MEGFKKIVYAEALSGLKDSVNEGGLEAVGKKVLDAAKITPVYTNEGNSETFEEDRKRLNTEAGIVVANHPGYYDTFLILNALKRKDVKIIASESNFKYFAPSIGEEYLIKATNDPTQALAFLRSIKDHIDNGGLVVIFPTGGVDRVDNDPTDFMFENGFSVIIKRCLKPGDMVYSFYINPEDIAALVDETIPRTPGTISAVALHPSININKFKDDAEVRVDERYSTADEWQQIVDDSEKEEKNAALSKHFTDSFKPPK